MTGRAAFVHLHVHSEFSLLDGAARIQAMFERAAEMQMPALALTDHGAMFGALQFYEAGIEAGVKPIVGVETYVAPTSRFERAPGEKDKRLIEAAHNLRCGRLRTIFTIVIPSARVGLVLAAAFAFTLCFGDYISPQLLGGSRPPTLSILIADQVKSGNNWPRASVVAVSMIATLMVVLGALMRVAYGGRKGQ